MRAVPGEAERAAAQDLDRYLAAARWLGEHDQARRAATGADESRVIGEYEPGSEIVNTDGVFPVRFLYAFWRLCTQDIAVSAPAEVRHAARLAADKAGVSPEVRVTGLRPAASAAGGSTDQDGAARWNHRWVVRMHKVRQWYPSEQRHKVIYRGPYVKGPDDKPLLGGDVVRSLTR